MNDDNPKKKDSAVQATDEEIEDLGYNIFLNNKESIFILLACTICMITLYHFETILAVRLIEGMGMSEDYLGYFFCS